MFGRLKTMDPLLIFSLLGLIAMGLVALYSSSNAAGDDAIRANYFQLQLRWVFLGLSAMVIMAVFLPVRIFYEFSYLAYAVALVLLALIFTNLGTTGLGATRWIRLGGIGIQPSELAKVATLLALGRFLSDDREGINNIKTFLIASLLIIIPFVMVARQPDLGTALVFAVIALPIFFWTGLRGGYLLLIVMPVLTLFASFHFLTFLTVMIAIVVTMYFVRLSVVTGFFYFLLNIAVGLLTPTLWNQLQDYQKQRITTFMNPEADPLGAGYQIIQSKVAIGSGGFFGTGFMQGTQTQLRFLPEQHTDFIFAVIGEEFGFMGVMFGVALFGLFLMRLVYIAGTVKSQFSSIITIGFATIVAFHMLVNLGMTIGLFPVTGLPLPFISYGGSGLVINLAIIGMILNFYRHRYEY